MLKNNIIMVAGVLLGCAALVAGIGIWFGSSVDNSKEEASQNNLPFVAPLNIDQLKAYQVTMTNTVASARTPYLMNISTPTINTDYDYVITYSNNSLSLYINWILIWSQTATVAPTSATNNLYVWYNWISNIRRFNGNMQCLRFYNRILSDKEIQLFEKERLKLLN